MDANIHRCSQSPLELCEGRHREQFPAPTAHLKPRLSGTACEQAAVRPHFLQGPDGVDPESHAQPDLAQPIGLLKYQRRDPHTFKRDGRGKTADSSADDDGFHLKVSDLSIILGEDNDPTRQTETSMQS